VKVAQSCSYFLYVQQPEQTDIYQTECSWQPNSEHF